MAKGGSTSQETNQPKFVEAGQQQQIGLGRDLSAMGYVPYYGPDIAAMSPMQIANMQNTNQMAGAFGMEAPSMEQMQGYAPAPTTYAGGVQGYSSAPVFEQAQQALQANAPGTYDYLNSFSVDPNTGQTGSRTANSQPVVYEMTKPSSGGK
mgnify:FL=1